MRLIDVDAVLHKINEITGEGWEAGYTASRCYDIVFNAETVDAVPVVRCKDCKHYDIELDGWCDIHSHFIGDVALVGFDWTRFDPDDYCSCGERREDGA